MDVLSSEQEVGVPEAAKRLGLSDPYVMNLITKGILPHRVDGGDHRIPLADLFDYMERQAPGREVALGNVLRQTTVLGR